MLDYLEFKLDTRWTTIDDTAHRSAMGLTPSVHPKLCPEAIAHAT